MMKSRENAENLFFRDISGIFGRKNMFFTYFFRHILEIAILQQCANFHEKILSTGLEIQVIPFFSDVPAIFRKFRLQKSF